MSEHKRNIQPDSIDTRVALLEQSIGHVNQTLTRIENDLRDFKSEIKKDMKDIRNEAKSNFRWILTVIGALGTIMAHGFHWF